MVSAWGISLTVTSGDVAHGFAHAVTSGDVARADSRTARTVTVTVTSDRYTLPNLHTFGCRRSQLTLRSSCVISAGANHPTRTYNRDGAGVGGSGLRSKPPARVVVGRDVWTGPGVEPPRQLL